MTYVHLLVGFFLLGTIIDIGRGVSHVLGITLDFFGFSFTASSGFVLVIALQAYTTYTSVKLRTAGAIKDVSTVVVYKAPPRVQGTSGSTTVSLLDQRCRC